MFVARSSLFSVRPRVRRMGTSLEISTPILLRALSGFSFRRTVAIDSARRSIYVSTTRAWFFGAFERLTFDDVDHVSYSFSSLVTSWDLFGRVHDQLEVFTVSLALRGSKEPFPVARFFGEGAAGDLVTFLMGDDLVDVSGTQEDDSRSFVKTLCQTLGVPLGPPMLTPKADANGRTWRCGSCGRSVVPKPKCLYCGGTARPRE